ncbi:MAG: methyltransferase [Acidobacteriota bacterium]
MIISAKTGQFAYFDAQLGAPRWRGKRVLDFGGNCGNLLAEAGDEVRAEDYWCLDVSREALAEGARRHPRAHWIHYDRHHARYNPHGRPRTPPPDLGRFDFILAYSVFTLMPEHEVRELVAALRRMLAPGGVLAFSFVDPEYRALRKTRVMSNIEWRLDVAGHCDTAFLSAERVKRIFPGAEVREPTQEVRHHCCILRAQRSVLAKAREVIREPFPHVVIEDALDDYRELADAFPGAELLRKGQTLASNEYSHVHADQILTDDRVAPVWQRFVRQHTSAAFFAEVVALFGLTHLETADTAVRYLECERPARTDRASSPDRMSGAGSPGGTPGECGRDARTPTVMMECQFAWCEPVNAVSSSAPRHVDRAVSLFAGLLYFRLEGDDSVGGDLQLYDGEHPVKTIPYRANTLVFFVNSPRALHGVTPRSITPWPRLHVNFVGEVPG